MSVVAQYDKFLLANLSQIEAIESSLRTVTYLLPGRFKDAELAGEAIYAALNLLGLHHDSVLARAAPSQSSVSEHTRYTRHWASKSRTYSTAAKTLVVIGHIELLVEMTARRKLGKRAWDVVAALEAIKVALRLSLLHTTGATCIHPPLPQRDAAAEKATPEEWKGARTGVVRPTLASLRPEVARSSTGSTTPTDRRPPHLRALQYNANSGSDSDDTLVDAAMASSVRLEIAKPTKPWTETEINEYLLSRVLTVNDVRRPEELVRPAPLVSEVVWILRPLLYVLAIRRWGKKATLPFALSFALEYLARHLRKETRKTGFGALFGSSPLASILASALTPAAASPVSAVERAEVARRSSALWLYLVRGPVWYGYTRVQIASVLARLPFVGDYLTLVDEYYYYTA